MSVKAAVYKRLKASAELMKAVNGNVFPQWRNEVEPALVYFLRMDEGDRGFSEGLLVTSWELQVVVVHGDEDEANRIAEAVVEHLDYTDWSEGDSVVLGCFLRSRNESSVEKTTSKVRLATVELVFDLEATEQE